MPMKKFELERNKGLKINEAIRRAGVPDRFGAAGAPDRREQRKLDAARGLVPFAAKLDGVLVKRLRDEAQARGVTPDALLGELLAQALPGPDDAAAASTLA